MHKVRRVVLSCTTSQGLVQCIVDLQTRKFWTETFGEGEGEERKTASSEPRDLETLNTRDILEFFSRAEGLRWKIGDGVVVAVFTNYKDFEDSVWYTVNKIRKYTKKDTQSPVR